MDREKGLKTVAEQESLLLSLAGGTLRCHSYPNFEQIEVLDCDSILDFEPFKIVSNKQSSRVGGKHCQHFLAVLLKSRVLKIFQFERAK